MTQSADDRPPTAERHADPIAHLLRHAEHLLADRSAPMCGHTGSLTTLWACVAELSSRRIRYAPGAPSHTPFVDVPSPHRH